MSEHNPYEEAARLRKVFACVEYIDKFFCEAGMNPHNPDNAALIAAQWQLADDAQWENLAFAAGTRELSDVSRREVVAVYCRRALGKKRPMGWRGDL
jgi:hypothetical protein